MPTRLLLLRVFRFASSTASTMASSFLSCSLDSCSMNNFVRPDTRTCRVLRSQIERTWACWVKKPWRNFAVDFSEQTWHTFEHDALQLMTLDTYFCHIFRVVGTGNALVMCSLALLVCEVQPCGNFWMFLAMLRRKSGKDRGVRGVACKPKSVLLKSCHISSGR